MGRKVSQSELFRASSYVCVRHGHEEVEGEVV